MGFDVNYRYGVATTEIEHISVPPQGRKLESADFAAFYVNGVAVGLVQRFSPRETRAVMPQYELGNIYPVEFVPSIFSGELEVNRLTIFKDSLFDAFQFNNALIQDTYDLANYWPSNKIGPRFASGPNVPGAGTTGPIITTLADIQWPMDLQLHITNPSPDVNGITIKTYLECWITSYATSYDAGAKVVAENVTFTYRNATITQSPIVNVANGDLSNLVTAPV